MRPCILTFARLARPSTRFHIQRASRSRPPCATASGLGCALDSQQLLGRTRIQIRSGSSPIWCAIPSGLPLCSGWVWSAAAGVQGRRCMQRLRADHPRYLQCTNAQPPISGRQRPCADSRGCTAPRNAPLALVGKSVAGLCLCIFSGFARALACRTFAAHGRNPAHGAQLTAACPDGNCRIRSSGMIGRSSCPCCFLRSCLLLARPWRGTVGTSATDCVSCYCGGWIGLCPCVALKYGGRVPSRFCPQTRTMTNRPHPAARTIVGPLGFWAQYQVMARLSLSHASRTSGS